MSFGNIRTRIAVTFAILIAVAMAALTGYIVGFVRDSYITQLQNQMVANARLLADAARPAFLTGGVARADALADDYAAILGQRVTFIDAGGAVIGDSEAGVDAMLNHLRRPEIVDACDQGLGVALRFSDTLQYEALYVAVPVATGQTSQGYVRLAVPLRAIDDTVGALRRRVLGASGIILVLTVAVGVILAERTARPLRELTAIAQRVTQGDMSARLVAHSRDEVGILTTTFFSMTDQLKSTIDDLARQRSEATAILEHMADGIVITDSAGRIQLINRAAQRILGVQERDALGASLPQVARDEEIILAFRACLAEQREQNELVDLARQNLYLQVIATPVFGPEGETRCLMVLQDVGQVRRLEAYRRDLVTNVSHELRTPIASLRALLDTLRDGAIDDQPAAVHFMDLMDTEIDELTRMVESLLELARIESGQMPVRLEPTRVQDLIEPVVERLQPLAQRSELTLQVQLPEGLPPVLADPDQVRLVVTNLVQNAIKFTPPGGRIVVEATRQGDVVNVSVQDTGVGIPADQLPRVFERFYKGDASRASRGAGLGLAIAKHIVQAHGGEISASSTVGQGSVFRFTLLVAPEGSSTPQL